MRRELCTMAGLTVCFLGGCVVPPEKPSWLDEYNRQFADGLWTQWKEAVREERQAEIDAAIEAAMAPLQDAPNRLEDLEETLGKVNGSYADALNDIRSDVREFEDRLPQDPANVSVDTFVNEQIRKITRSRSSAIKDFVDALEARITPRLNALADSVTRGSKTASAARGALREELETSIAAVNQKMDAAVADQEEFRQGIEDLSVLRRPFTTLLRESNVVERTEDLERLVSPFLWGTLGAASLLVGVPLILNRRIKDSVLIAENSAKAARTAQEAADRALGETQKSQAP